MTTHQELRDERQQAIDRIEATTNRIIADAKARQEREQAVDDWYGQWWIVKAWRAAIDRIAI